MAGRIRDASGQVRPGFAGDQQVGHAAAAGFELENAVAGGIQVHGAPGGVVEDEHVFLRGDDRRHGVVHEAGGFLVVVAGAVVEFEAFAAPVHFSERAGASAEEFFAVRKPEAEAPGIILLEKSLLLLDQGAVLEAVGQAEGALPDLDREAGGKQGKGLRRLDQPGLHRCRRGGQGAGGRRGGLAGRREDGFQRLIRQQRECQCAVGKTERECSGIAGMVQQVAHDFLGGDGDGQ